jgi:hypothetical protein
MATQQAMDEADIRRRVNALVEAIRAMDLESVTSIALPTSCHMTWGRCCGRREQRQKGKTGWRHSPGSNLRSVTRFATSKSLWAMAWRSDTASIG